MINFPCRVCYKSVGIRHHAIECDICKTWVHIKCNKLDKKDYHFYQNNPDEPFICIKCTEESLPFMCLNENQFKIAVDKGINFPGDINVQFQPNPTEQRLFAKINNAINGISLDVNNDEDDDCDGTSFDCKYYSIPEFESKKFKSEKTFSILHLNIHSIELHIEDLRIVLEMLDFKFDFICLSESKILKDINPKVNIDIDGYQPPLGTSTESTKGGVLLYAKVGINFIPRDDLSGSMYKSKELESFFVEVVNPNESNNIVGVIYRHPCMNEILFNDDYIKPLNEKLSSENKTIYLSGDFNFDLLSASSHTETSDFFDSMMSSFLLPTITIPTKINSVKSTVIDNIFTNNINPDLCSGNLAIGISDHLPSFAIVPKKNQNHMPKKQALYRRNTKKFDRENFLLDYLNINWDEVLEIDKNDTNHSAASFMKKINYLLDKHMPIKKVSQKEFKQKFKPWITNDILHKIDEKNKLFNKYVHLKNVDQKLRIFNEYKLAKNRITFLIRESKKAYYNNYFSKHKKNLQKVWKGIKEIINIKNKNFDHPTSLLDNKKFIDDPTQMANAFNNFFTSIADDILKKRKYEGNKSFRDYLLNPIPNSLLLYECEEIELKSIIKSLDSKKASGPNSIDTNILHLLIEEICNPLCKIFNLSFSTGQHPDIFKIAKTIPIFKKGSRLMVSNYRPISLLSNLNKILEKLMFSRVYKFLDDYQCIYSLQFGFRSKHSTNHALIDITENIRKALDNKSFACGIFVDLQKAFDTVNHNILLKKLDYYGIRGTVNDWFACYLNRVHISSSTSSTSTSQ